MTYAETIAPALAFYPPAPTNGGRLDETTPPKIGDWSWQPKIDDWRGAVHVPSGTVWNQYGERSALADRNKIGIALATLRDFNEASGRAFTWLDVGIMEARHDMMRGCIIVFDIMDDRFAHSVRRVVLEKFIPVLPPAYTLLSAGCVHNHVYLVNEWRNEFLNSEAMPLRLQQRLLQWNADIRRKFYEGLVAKRRDARYPLCTRPKQKVTCWVKHRFDQ